MKSKSVGRLGIFLIDLELYAEVCDPTELFEYVYTDSDKWIRQYDVESDE